MDAQNRRSVLPLPVPRTELDPDLVFDAIDEVARYGSQSHGLTIEVDHSFEPDPIITVTEQERHVSISLSQLTAALGLAGTGPSMFAVKQALSEWLNTRPVSDATAAARGIATIDWNHSQSHVSWRVAVSRATGAPVGWVPTTHTPPEFVRQVRVEALRRAQQLAVSPTPTGEVTVWAHLPDASLSTSVLAQPNLLANGQPLENLCAVFSPGGPVAVATPAAARRLTEESNEPHVTLSLAELNTIGWA